MAHLPHDRFGNEVPDEGPVLLVANHPNGLIDPILIGHTPGRPVYILGKAPLFDMPVIGLLARGGPATPRSSNFRITASA